MSRNKSYWRDSALIDALILTVAFAPLIAALLQIFLGD